MKSYEFGPFRLIWERRQLLRNGRVVPLQAKTLQLLQLLIENQGRPLSKEEIMLELWSDRAVEENNLTQRIYHLRRALSSSPETASAIVTVPGVGYLFTCAVREASVADAGVNELLADQPPSVSPTPSTGDVEGEGDEEWEESGSGGIAVAAEPPGEVQAGLGRIWRSRRAMVRAGVAAIVVIALIAMVLLRGSYRKSDRSGAPTLLVKPLTSLPGIEQSPTFSPDGKMIAFTWDGDTLNNRDVYVSLVASSNAVRVTSHASEETQPVWSADGQYIAALRHPEVSGDKFHLIIVPAFGGKEREAGRVWGGLDWSPDGNWLAVSDNEQRGTATGIYLISPDGSRRQAISKPQPEKEIFDNYPHFSPDGRRLAFVRWVSDGSGDIFIAELGSGKLRQLTFDGKRIRSLQWSPDGDEIFFVSSRTGTNLLWRIPASGGALQPVGNITPNVEEITISRADGRLAFSQVINDRTIEVFSLAPQGPPPCEINSSRMEFSPQISPDGETIAFDSDKSGAFEIWTASRDCSRLFQVTRINSTNGGSPRWSMDGERLFFCGDYGGQFEVFSINRDGTGLRQLTNHPSSDVLPSPSRDGRWVYFTSGRSGVYRIYRIPIDGGEAIQVTSNEGANPIESFDGRTLFYTHNDTIWTKDLASGEERPIPELLNVTVFRQWNVTPQAIYYIPRDRASTGRIHRLDLTSRRITIPNQREVAVLSYLPGISVSMDEKLVARSYLKFSLGDITIAEGWR